MIFLNFRTENTRESVWRMLAISLDTTWLYFRFQSTPKKTLKGVWKQLNSFLFSCFLYLNVLVEKKIFILLLTCYLLQIFRAWLHVTWKQNDGNARGLPVMPASPRLVTSLVTPAVTRLTPRPPWQRDMWQYSLPSQTVGAGGVTCPTVSMFDAIITWLNFVKRFSWILRSVKMKLMLWLTPDYSWGNVESTQSNLLRR